jgi:hypothetical protein
MTYGLNLRIVNAGEMHWNHVFDGSDSPRLPAASAAVLG